MKRLHAFDLVLLGYLAIVSLLLVATGAPGTPLFLAYHAGAAGLVFAIAWAHDRFGGPVWGILRYWYLVPALMACFRGLHYQVPAVHPFDDLEWDAALARIDRRWLGDVDGFFLGVLNPFTAELLHLCYVSYFFSMIAVAAFLHLRGEMGRLREYVCVMLTAILVSYLFYFAVPAVGPHQLYAERPAVLDGWLLGGFFHRTLMSLELRMADAFPSGHTLMSLVTIAMSWRYDRRLFKWLVGPAAGCIVATVGLRYHYAIDAIASFALFPAVTWLGFAIHRAVEGREDGRRKTEDPTEDRAEDRRSKIEARGIPPFSPP